MRITVPDDIYWKLAEMAAVEKIPTPRFIYNVLSGLVVNGKNGKVENKPNGQSTKPKKGVMPIEPANREPNAVTVAGGQPSGERVGGTTDFSKIDPLKTYLPTQTEVTPKVKWTEVPIWKDPINRGNSCPDCKVEEGNKHRAVCNYATRSKNAD